MDLDRIGEALVIAFPLVWICGWVLASFVYRRLAGKPIFPKAPPDALFRQRGASGCDMVPAFRSIGGASGILLVAVTPHELIVTPTFPFTLFFLPEIWGLDYRVPRSAIRAVEHRKGLLGWPVLRLSFEANGPGCIELRLRRPDAFEAALRGGV